MYKKLSQQFFDRPTLDVAEELLGKYLIRQIGDRKIEGMITDVEAYIGQDDLACHASKGRTKRTEVMFGSPGHAYVYMIYGMYFCLNIVTEREGYPAAILIRGVCLAPHGCSNVVSELERRRCNFSRAPSRKIRIAERDQTQLSKKDIINGPGKLCRHFQIDKILNNEDITTSNQLWIEDRGVAINSRYIKTGSRINIDYAGDYAHKPWRFFIEM